MNQNPMGTTRADEFIHDVPQIEMQLARDVALMLGTVGLASTVIVGALAAAAVSAAPVWIVLPLFVAFGFAAIVAIMVVKTLGRVRALVESVLWEWRENQNAAREIAHITATQQTTVSVKGRSNVVSVNSAGAVESVRLVGVNVNAPRRMVDGVDERDLIYFCERAPLIGHAKRRWLGAQLPSGKLVSTFEDYNQLVAPLLKAGLIAGRSERSAGKLVSSDPGELRQALGLPSGANDSNQIAPAIEGELKAVN